MPVYEFEAEDGERIEEVCSIVRIPKTLKKNGKEYRRVFSVPGRPHMGAESSDRYQMWFHSDAVQDKLRTGEYTIASKSDDVNHL